MSTSNEQAAAAAATAQTTEQPALLDRLLREFRPREERDKENLQGLLKKFLGEVMKQHTIDADVERQLDSLIAHIDRTLTAQIDEVLHHESFQKLEASWRGLKYLVDQTNSGPELKIKVLNVTRRELIKDLERAGSTERSNIYHTVVEAEYGQAGGKPFGMLVGDYEFTHKNEDMFLLQEMAKIGASGNVPFAAGASPEIFGLESFDHLTGPDKISGVFEGVDFAKWRSFRESEDSRFLALTMPRVLARIPYGEDTKKVDAFQYEEGVDGRDHKKYLWMSSAWAYAARVTDAFDRDGWLARTRGVDGGGKVADLPTHTFLTDEGGKVMKCPTEVSLPWWREKELSDLGFMPLIHWKDTDYAAFVGTQSCQKPKQYLGPLGADATDNAAISAKFNYILCVSRFSHFLKSMLARWLGSRMSRDELQDKLNMWIRSYVVDNPGQLSEADRYKYPLKEANIDVTPIPGQPGWYQAVARLVPHLHLEGVTVSMRMVAKMPPKG